MACCSCLLPRQDHGTFQIQVSGRLLPSGIVTLYIFSSFCLHNIVMMMLIVKGKQYRTLQLLSDTVLAHFLLWLLAWLHKGIFFAQQRPKRPPSSSHFPLARRHPKVADQLILLRERERLIKFRARSLSLSAKALQRHSIARGKPV